MKPKDFEVIYKITIASAVPFPSALNWNAEAIGELIRCKDCKHCNREMAVGEWEGSCRYWNTHSVMLNDFCSRAERKDDETD